MYVVLFYQIVKQMRHVSSEAFLMSSSIIYPGFDKWYIKVIYLSFGSYVCLSCRFDRPLTKVFSNYYLQFQDGAVGVGYCCYCQWQLSIALWYLVAARQPVRTKMTTWVFTCLVLHCMLVYFMFFFLSQLMLGQDVVNDYVGS